MPERRVLRLAKEMEKNALRLHLHRHMSSVNQQFSVCQGRVYPLLPNQPKRKPVKKLSKLSWRARSSGTTCTAEVDQPIRGYRVKPNRFATATESGPLGPIPTVSWISFDGDIYWVRLSTALGWPRTIRVTQNDVDGVPRQSA